MDIATGPVSQQRLSAGQQPQTSIMLDGIKIEDHPLRSGQATLGVMLGEFPRTVGKSALFHTSGHHMNEKPFCMGVINDLRSFPGSASQKIRIPTQITHRKKCIFAGPIIKKIYPLRHGFHPYINFHAHHLRPFIDTIKMPFFFLWAFR